MYVSNLCEVFHQKTKEDMNELEKVLSEPFVEYYIVS